MHGEQAFKACSTMRLQRLVVMQKFLLNRARKQAGAGLTMIEGAIQVTERRKAHLILRMHLFANIRCTGGLANGASFAY